MILRHNLKQLFLAPLHLLASALAYWFCWRLCERFRNLIPWHDAARERFERWHRFAEERGGWHSEALYSQDPEALDWLILSGCLDHSPTKALVAFRKR